MQVLYTGGASCAACALVMRRCNAVGGWIAGHRPAFLAPDLVGATARPPGVPRCKLAQRTSGSACIWVAKIDDEPHALAEHGLLEVIFLPHSINACRNASRL
jgi:hypothetical protein